MTEIRPAVSTSALLTDMVPPRHFHTSSFETYRPAHPSQRTARDAMALFADEALAPRRSWLRKPQPRAIYLDGGFGVGKTHLLAAVAHVVGPQHSTFATFSEYTHLVGLLGFAGTRDVLAGRTVVCIDEFELDDVADTLLISRLVRELMDAGVWIAVTSNTLPEALGEGRFAAADFAREIGDLARRFDVISVDGHDYRMRTVDLSDEERAVDLAQLEQDAERHTIAIDEFDDLLRHLATVHQGTYRDLVRTLDGAVWLGTHELDSEFAALRLVVLIDRLYDEQVPLRVQGTAALFSRLMLRGGYRKKYLRALSRLSELTAMPFPASGG